jgi:metal-responsive CopG/Arc/MetJ family transcriptional regulator
MAKILLSLPDKFIEEVDEFCKDKSYTRSELIRQALREKIKNESK